ncbi:DMT family transporter [Bacillota bacterium LX-D]|nr:DMT family transporter [Bacillota bacterium LX-D]
MHHERKGALLVIASAIFIGTEAIFTKLCYASGLNLWTMLTIRYLISSVILVAIASTLGHTLKLKNISWPNLSIVLTAYLVTVALLSKAYYYLPASLAIMFFFAYPTITAIMVYFINGEIISKVKLIALIMSTFGLILLLWSSWTNIKVIGIYLALGAALCNTFYLIFSNRVLKEISESSLTAWLYIVGTFVFSIVGLSSGEITLSFAWQGWVYVACLSIISSVLATLAFFSGLKLIGPSLAAIISATEPPVTAFLAFLVFGEVLTGIQLFGALLIIFAVILPQIRGRK